MKKNMLIQVGTRTEQRFATSYDDDGNEVIKVIAVEVPVMKAVYVDMTPEEIAELPQEEPQEEPTQEDRLSAIEDLLLEMLGV